MPNRRLLLILLFLLNAPLVFSQRGEVQAMRPQRNMQFSVGNGQRIPAHPNFSMIGVKAELNGDILTFSLYFNDVVDTNSFTPERFLIDGRALERRTDFFFNKNRHMARFSIPRGEETFSLLVSGLRSFDGRPMKPVEIPAFEINSFFKYSRETREWQKSSL